MYALVRVLQKIICKQSSNLDQAIQLVSSVLDVHIYMREELTQPIEDLIEVTQDVSPGHFGDVVPNMIQVKIRVSIFKVYLNVMNVFTSIYVYEIFKQK